MTAPPIRESGILTLDEDDGMGNGVTLREYLSDETFDWPIVNRARLLATITALHNLTTPPAPIRPSLRLKATKATGVDWAPYVLALAKEAALKADVSLRWWHEFSATARACFTESALPEEQSKFMDVVRERFDVIEF